MDVQKNKEFGSTLFFPITKMSSLNQHSLTVAPVAYQVILEPGIGQFREFESPECILV